MAEESTVTAESDRNKWLIAVAGILLVALLAGAAFVGGRLLATAEPERDGPDLPAGMALNPGAGEDMQVRDLSQMKPAPELPARMPDERGLFVRRSDDIIVIGTGNVMARITDDPNAVPEFNYDGIEVEIVVTNQTELYEDITEFTPGEAAVQQQVQELSNLDDLSESTVLQVWGRRNGDRIIAETIVVLNPRGLPGR